MKLWRIINITLSALLCLVIVYVRTFDKLPDNVLTINKEVISRHENGKPSVIKEIHDDADESNYTLRYYNKYGYELYSKDVSNSTESNEDDGYRIWHIRYWEESHNHEHYRFFHKNGHLTEEYIIRYDSSMGSLVQYYHNVEIHRTIKLPTPKLNDLDNIVGEAFYFDSTSKKLDSLKVKDIIGSNIFEENHNVDVCARIIHQTPHTPSVKINYFTNGTVSSFEELDTISKEGKYVHFFENGDSLVRYDFYDENELNLPFKNWDRDGSSNYVFFKSEDEIIMRSTDANGVSIDTQILRDENGMIRVPTLETWQ